MRTHLLQHHVALEAQFHSLGLLGERVGSQSTQCLVQCDRGRFVHIQKVHAWVSGHVARWERWGRGRVGGQITSR